MKKQTKIGIALIFSPIIALIIIGILIILTIIIEHPFFWDNIFIPIASALLIPLVLSPILLGIGIYLIIKNRDKNKKFKITNQVSKKRMVIGRIMLFGIVSPFLLSLLILPPIYDQLVSNIRKDIREEYESIYATQCYQKDGTLRGDSPLKPTLIGNYEFEPDEYIWYLNQIDESHYDLAEYISIPKAYIPKEVFSVKQSWNLKNNYKLDLVCDSVDVRKVELENSSKCTISYNNKVLDREVRHDIFCLWEKNKSCSDNIGVVVYSNKLSQGDVEYLLIFSRESKNHNKLSMYKLENGEALILPFKYEHKGESFSDISYTVSGINFKLVGIKKFGTFDQLSDGPVELLTFFNEPTMGVYNNIAGIQSIWSVEKDGLYLRKTQMELIKGWKSEGTKEEV